MGAYRLSFVLSLPLIALQMNCGPGPEVAASSQRAAALNSGPWYGAELHSRQRFGRIGVPLRITFRAAPARGNCVITALAIYNAERVFTENRGHWSEITFEIFGGSAQRPDAPALQTQYITYQQPSDPPAARGRQHLVPHRAPKIWYGRSHDFQLEWLPGGAGYLVFRIDGQELRRVSGEDLGRLEPDLTIYASTWMARRDIQWGCTDDSDRPDATSATIASIEVEEDAGGGWRSVASNAFSSSGEIQRDFNLSTTTWEAFDGKFCPANVTWRGPGQVELALKKRCGS